MGCPVTDIVYCMQASALSSDSSQQVTLARLADTRLLMTASFLDGPLLVPLGPKRLVQCSELWQALTQAFAGARTPCPHATVACTSRQLMCQVMQAACMGFLHALQNSCRFVATSTVAKHAAVNARAGLTWQDF